MLTDLNYVERADHKLIGVVGESDTPEVLKRAMTLMLFSNDPDIRNFKGSSVVNVFSTLPQSSFDEINFYLTLAAARMREILSGMYPTLADVYFEAQDDAPTLKVTLNVRMSDSDNVLTSVVYNE